MALFDHQINFISRKVRKGLLVWGTGTGKSITSIHWGYDIGNRSSSATYDENGNKSYVKMILVICPKYLKDKWRKEFYSAFPEVGPDPVNKEIIDSNFKNDVIRIVSKEEFRRDWDKLPKFEAVIVDEAHYFAGVKSQMSKNLGKYVKKHKIQNVLGLTATPFLSSPMNIYTLGKNIAGKTDHDWSYPKFVSEFYDEVVMGKRMNKFTKKLEPNVVPVMKRGIEQKLSEKIREIADIVDMKDCVDMPPENHVVEYFQMTADQNRAVKALVDTNHLTRWTKIHQICGGYLKGDAYNAPQEIKSDKMARAMEHIAANRKCIVVTRYVGEGEVMAREVLNSSDEAMSKKKVLMINGDVKDKQSVLDEANASDDCVLFVTAACSEGWEASSFDTMIFYSYDFSLKNYIQMKGRIQRINAIHPCAYISLIVEKTIDEDVYKNVAVKKTDFHLSIYKNDSHVNMTDNGFPTADNGTVTVAVTYSDRGDGTMRWVTTTGTA